MEFHAWQTMLDECRKLYPEAKHTALDKLAATNRRSIEEHRFTYECNRKHRLLRNDAEYAWEKAGRPFYNLHPSLVPAIAKTNLDRIPTSLIEVPGNFPAVNLRFSNTDEFMSPILGMLFSKQSDGVRLFLDLGQRELIGNQPITLCSTLHLPIDNETESIPESLERLVNRHTENAKAHSTNDNESELLSLLFNAAFFVDALRIAVTVGFLANQNDDMIVRDVLAKDRTSYRQSLVQENFSRRMKIEDRATRRGKLGWNVGTNEMFVDWYPPKPHHEPDGIRGPHKSAHIRTGHFHAVRCGKGRSQVKVKWFRPTVVRPDLPFSEK